MTTGHEWNGIKELNTPVPKAVWFFLTIAVLFAIGYWLLMPAWPLGNSYTRGLLGIDQKQIVTSQVRQASAERSAWTGRIAAMGYDDILADKALMTIVRRDGHRLFGDNCAVCHGLDATGSKGFPNLVDRDWLWGGDPQAVAHTIDVGINSSDQQTQLGQMLAFGRDGMLEPPAVANVALYVRSLSDPGLVTRANLPSIRAGGEAFAANCAQCHGDGKGVARMPGVPNLADSIWLYGGDADSIYTSIHEGRQGEMPAWKDRLGPVERKILTVYVLDRGRAGQ